MSPTAESKLFHWTFSRRNAAGEVKSAQLLDLFSETPTEAPKRVVCRILVPITGIIGPKPSTPGIQKALNGPPRTQRTAIEPSELYISELTVHRL